MANLYIFLGSSSAMLAVVFGAFGAHALKNKLDSYGLSVYETAVQYHFYHSFALLLVGIIALSQPETVLLKSSGWLFLIGIFIFCGSLYTLSLTGLSWLGAVTPLGGLAFIAGWACLAAAAWNLMAR